MTKRSRYVRHLLRQGPTEAGYAFFRARRRRRNLADDDNLLGPDRLVMSPDFAVEAEDLEANARAVDAQLAAGPREIRTVRWLVPGFYLVWGGGVLTILRLADHLARRHGVRNSFIIFDSNDPLVVERVRRGIAQAFPSLADSPVDGADGPLSPTDATVATAWESAWMLVRMRDAGDKFMFVQDWEPDFYPAGSASAMLEEVARLGIPAMVNGPALADSYRACGSPAMSFTPAVDVERFHAPAARSDGPVRVVFYGRPSTPRNAFGLGLETLRRVKRRHRDAVEIVCAGEDWTPGQYGMTGVLENVGLLENLDQVAELYRSCDVGLVFMLTRHPSYQPLEFMASGLVTVTNQNPHTGWLLTHEHNALLSRPVPALVADQVTRLVEDPVLRQRLAQAGRATVEALSWEDELEKVWRAMSGQEPFDAPTDARRSAVPHG